MNDKELTKPNDVEPVLLAIVRACANGVSTQAILWALDNTYSGATKLVLRHDGDQAGGLSGATACVELDLRGYPEPDRDAALKRVKDLLAHAFTEFWGTRAKVQVVPPFSSPAEA